jgi:hypothetical protein
MIGRKQRVSKGKIRVQKHQQHGDFGDTFMTVYIGKSVRTEPLLYEKAENGSSTKTSIHPGLNASSCVSTPKI